MTLKLKKLKLLFNQFGFFFSIRYCLFKVLKWDDRYIELIYKYLKKEMDQVINKYNSISPNSLSTNEKSTVPVWFCWFQGEEQMPELCKLNYNQLKKMLPTSATLNLVTMDNFMEYVDIPTYILDKFKDGKISYTHLSDVLRWSLLERWGGIWIDSTIYCTKEISEEFLFSPDLWSIRLDKVHDSQYLGQVISECRWSGFLLKDNSSSLLVKYVLESKLLYWEKHDIIIDYFLQNFLIKIAYDNIDSIKNEIDNIYLSNKNIYDLHPVMDKEFNLNEYTSLLEETTFFKLTWKKKYLKTSNNKTTFYGYVYNKADME